VEAVYGSASATPASFTVTGTDMTAGILITPPAGFEVSQTGPSSGYAATQLVGAAGVIPPTTNHIRLAAGTSTGSYSGDIALTSTGAAPATLAMAISDVRPKLLTLTADNRSKPYGTTLTLGAGQTAFSTSGLVGSETIGSVTLTASGGTAAGDTPGIYQITPSAATGGTFNPGNYDIDYVDGTLTVTGGTTSGFEDWIAAHPGLADPTPAGDPDGDGVSNLLEYFAGLDPAAADGPVVISTHTGSGTLTMTYRRAKGTSGVSGTVKWSSDLTAQAWSTNGITETTEDKGTYEERTASIPLLPGESRRFMRLEVSQP